MYGILTINARRSFFAKMDLLGVILDIAIVTPKVANEA